MRGPLIIGGGPAGAAAAALIAAAGHPVTLIERSRGPVDKLCGDFLSGGAVAALRRLGVDVDALTGEFTPVRTIRLVTGSIVAEAALPFPAVGISRRKLDEMLLQVAAERGATILRGLTVRNLEHTSAGFVVHTAATGSAPAGTAALAGPVAATSTPTAFGSAVGSLTAPGPLPADAVFLATGKHDLRGQGRPWRDNGLLGLKMYYRLTPAQHAALQACIELLLLRGGYAGLQLVDAERAVLCLLLPAERYRRANKSWPALLADLTAEAPLLQCRLAGAVACLGQPLAIAGIPYGHLHRPARHDTANLFRLGDQACVVPSFAGDGIAIALHSAATAAAAWLRGDSAADYHTDFVRQASAPMRFASLLHLACRLPALQPVLAAACRRWPGSLRLAASLSRVAPFGGGSDD